MAGARQQSQERAPTAKEMTRQHTDCSSMFSTKLFHVFMLVLNTHAGILHTGSNQHNEPVNHVSKVGWVNCILPTKLGGANPRPMGTASCGWLPPGVDRGLNTGQSTSPNEMFTREQEPDSLRGSGALVQRGSLGDTSLNKERCVPDFPGGKEGRGSETSDKPEGSQPICEGRALPDLLQSQDWMVKMDLKDAYLQVPIHPDYQHLLAFQWEEKTYRLQCLPFGLSAASRVFTKLLKPVVGFLRQIGCRLIIYLDDLLMMHQGRAQLEQITQLICQLFESLGLIVNQKKSILTPTQELEFLGFRLCSMTMRLSLPPKKLRKIA